MESKQLAWQSHKDPHDQDQDRSKQWRDPRPNTGGRLAPPIEIDGFALDLTQGPRTGRQLLSWSSISGVFYGDGQPLAIAHTRARPRIPEPKETTQQRRFALRYEVA